MLYIQLDERQTTKYDLSLGAAPARGIKLAHQETRGASLEEEEGEESGEESEEEQE